MPSIVDKSSVTKVCVDDFALRKRFSYGTVMVDLESHRIIDLIPSRETSDVAKWLATFPNIQVISRDGAAVYSSAATDSHPEAVQVSDRFHLIKGLSEAINKYIIREFPARVEIPLTESVSEEMKALYNTANRPLRIRFAHQKRKEGLAVSDIALLLHSCPATVKNTLPFQKIRSQIAKLSPGKDNTNWQCSKNSRRSTKPENWRRPDIQLNRFQP